METECPIIDSSFDNDDMEKLKFINYSSTEIQAMRKFLKESREEFGRYFFVSAKTVKSWEIGKREPGPSVFVILQLLDNEIKIRRKDHAATLYVVRERLRNTTPLWLHAIYSGE